MQRSLVTRVDSLHYNCAGGSSYPEVHFAHKKLFQLICPPSQVTSCHCTVVSFGDSYGDSACEGQWLERTFSIQEFSFMKVL